ncbi:MAG: SBBP repeat-containing protein [Ignavibacteria bacterium]|nr:SBBP repeat-containing protein [Ignavibacteria bacterium]
MIQKTGKLILLLFITNCSLQIAKAQPTLEWVRTYNSPENVPDHFIDMVTDRFGNVYVTGWNVSASNDIITVKYSNSGAFQYGVSYNGTGNSNDISNGMAVDSNGNCYVAGYSSFNFGPSDGIIIKYNNTGDTVWTRKLATSLSDDFTSISIDKNNFIYAAGRSGDSAVVIKFDSAGNNIWRASYREPPFNIILGGKILIDRFNNILIGCTKHITSSQYSADFLVRKYNQNGSLLWASTYGNPANVSDWMTGYVIDNSGNSYATGYSEVNGRDIITVKFNNNGALSWAKLYNGSSNAIDQGNSVVCDSAGSNIFITGFTFVTGESRNYITIKYNSFGDTQWVRTYNGPGNYQDNAMDIALDKLTNVYITGESYNINDFDFATIKYDINGKQEWLVRWGYGDDRSKKIKVDINMNIFVGGGEFISEPTFNDLIIIKYTQTTGIHALNENIPDKFHLMQNYPNPFNPVTNIGFKIKEFGLTTMIIYNSLGEKIETIINQNLYPGEYKIQWDAEKYSSGIYYCSLETDDHKEIIKMILIK